MTAAGQGQYGRFRYGEVQDSRQTGPPPARRGAARIARSEAEILGRGLALNPAHADGYDWDLVIGADGSLLMTAGIDEYAKDMAFMTAAELYQFRGNLVTPELIADLELEIERLVAAEQRTESVSTIAVSQPAKNTIRVDIAATLANGDELSTAFGIPSPSAIS